MAYFPDDGDIVRAFGLLAMEFAFIDTKLNILCNEIEGYKERRKFAKTLEILNKHIRIKSTDCSDKEERKKNNLLLLKDLEKLFQRRNDLLHGMIFVKNGVTYWQKFEEPKPIESEHLYCLINKITEFGFFDEKIRLFLERKCLSQYFA
jgi:hypothetical protein